MDAKTASAANRDLKSQLRRRLRRARRGFAEPERSVAEAQICRNLQRIPTFRRARTIAAFMAFDGEPALTRLFTDVRNTGKRFLVPVIRSQRMQFAPLPSPRSTVRNVFGIAEPKERRREPTRTIDIVLVPLVGFDESGNRLGMGGGYYDRHFSFLRERKHFLRPRLIGVAFELQHVTKIPADAWDVPLWGIVTERRFIRI